MTEQPAHPYKTKSSRAFWSRSVSNNFDPTTLLGGDGFLIRSQDKVVSAGSCFASNLVPFLETSGLHYLRTEARHPAFAEAQRPTIPSELPADASPAGTAKLIDGLVRLFRRPPPVKPIAKPPASHDNFGYANFSAAYGNIYTARQLVQLLRRATGRFTPAESFWRADDAIIDPFRPGLRHNARTVVEFEALTRQHLMRTHQAFREADVFVLTLGLTEAWVSRDDGAVFPACPGTIAGVFDPDRHVFHNFTVAEIAADLDDFVVELREMNSSCRFILTVSPVPLVATATEDHVLCASTYSKSVLRVAAQETAARHTGVTYFPAYEIVTGPQAPKAFLAPDRRNVTQDAVETVMSALLSRCEVSRAIQTPAAAGVKIASAAAASTAIVDGDCEELMSER